MATHDPKLDILIVDDEPTIVEALSDSLKAHNLKSAGDGAKALKLFNESKFDLVLLDLKLPDKDGMGILKQMKEAEPGCEVVIITGDGSAERAVEAIKNGAYDYLTKPFTAEAVKGIIEKTRVNIKRRKELELLRSECKRISIDNEIVGDSEPMEEVFQSIKQASGNSKPVLVIGQIGTGKEMVARAIHRESNRKDKPFVIVSCSDSTDQITERDLFGWSKGAFDGAGTAQVGKLEIADGGTIFFDEINKIGEGLQNKILKLMDEGVFTRKGETKQRKVDVRIIASSSDNLYLEVHAGLFHEDLYNHLSTVLIEVPNLKSRGKDIITLTKHFLKMECKRRNKSVRGVNGKILNAFLKYSWPANVRELKSICERLVILAMPGELLDVDRLPPEIYTGVHRGRKIPGLSGKFQYDERLYDVLDRIETEYIARILQKYNYNQSHAARVLGIHRNTLLLKLRKLQIPLERKRRRLIKTGPAGRIITGE